jgi:hypothetical protein
VDFSALGLYLREVGFGGLVSVENAMMTDPSDSIRAILAKLKGESATAI